MLEYHLSCLNTLLKQIRSRLKNHNKKMLEVDFWQDKSSSKKTIIEAYKNINLQNQNDLNLDIDNRLKNNNILKFY